MINLYFNCEKQILTRTDREDLASNSREIHKCNFNLSNDWDDMQITAVFKYMGRKWDVLLTDNACTVPAEVLEGQEGFTVGLYGTNGDQVITSTLITVPVSKGANASGGGNAQITPSMFDQIMAKIEEIEEGQIDPESIEAAIDEYLRENPDAIINPTEVYNAITRSRFMNLIPKYTEYRDGLEKTDATPGVNYYVLAPGHMGNQEDRFEYGPIVITVMAPGASRASYYYLLKRAGYLPAGKYKLKNAWETNDPNISIIYGYTAEGAEHVLAEVTTTNEIAEFEITQEIINAGYDQILYIKLSEGAVGGELFPLLTYGDVTDLDNVPEGYVDNNEELTKATYELKGRVTELEEHGTGTTPVISAAATVDNTTGTPAVNVSKTGTDAAPEFTFAFSGLKGPKGDPGAPGASYDDTEIRAEIDNTNQNIRLGRTDYDYNLEFGFYNASGVWTASSKHASVHELLSFPSGITLRASTTLSGVTASIKEFSASGTRLRVVQGNSVVLTDIVEGNKYNFDFFRSNDYAELPSNGYFIQSIPDYFASVDASIEQINSSLDNLKQESAYSYTAATQTLELINHDTKYILKRDINTAVNLDSWRLYAGYIKINGAWSNMWEGSDAEGPIKIDNESDFISGFHGDEVLQNIAIYIDNALLDTSADSEGTFDSVVLYQTSTVYQADSQNAAFTRYKKVSFQGNNYSVQQRWKALIDCLINSSAMGLVQCYKTNIIGWDTDVLIPLQSKNSGSTALSSETRRGDFILADGKMITIIADQGMNDEYFKARLEDFTEQNRLKFYFSMHEGQSLNVNDEITSKFSVVVNNYVAR